VSFFYRQTKSKVAKLALHMVKDLPHLAEYGIDNDLKITEDVKSDARKYVSSLYCKDSQFCSLNMLRQHLFAKSWSDLRSLPPTEDAFHLHLLRSLYEIALYKRAYCCELDLPPVTDFECKLQNVVLALIMMSKHAEPSTL
jgi:hypothetical protein